MKTHVANYYEDTRKYYASYHNHKETSAWAGLVLYVLFCGAVTKLNGPSKAPLYFNIGFTTFLMIIALLIFFYVRNQFLLKDVAAAHAAAATYLLSEIVVLDDSSFDATKYMAVEESDDPKYQASHCLPKIILEKSRIMKTRGSLAALTTKILAYCIIFVITIGTIMSRWST